MAIASSLKMNERQFVTQCGEISIEATLIIESPAALVVHAALAKESFRAALSTTKGVLISSVAEPATPVP